jgi:hypothetical protein
VTAQTARGTRRRGLRRRGSDLHPRHAAGRQHAAGADSRRAQHAIDGTRELPNILSLAQKLRRRSSGGERPGYPHMLASLDRDTRRTLGEDYIEQTRIHRGEAPRFIDKMPNNFRHIGLIHLMLPRAKIIDARREPMACCFSNFQQLFAEGQEFSYDLADVGHYYRDYVRLMAHWDAVLPGRVYRLQHERAAG